MRAPDWRYSLVVVCLALTPLLISRPAHGVTTTKVEWVCNGGWTNDGLGGSGGSSCAAGNASQPITSLVVNAATAYTIGIYGVKYNGGGNIRWRVDGGAWSAAVSTQAGSLTFDSLYGTTASLSAGSHTVEVENNAGYTYIDYVNVNAEDPPPTTTTTTTAPTTTTTTAPPTTTTTLPTTTTTSAPPPTPEGMTKDQGDGLLLAAGVGAFYASARFAERIGRRH